MKNLRSITLSLAILGLSENAVSFSVHSSLRLRNHVSGTESTTSLHLEDSVANMIDLELLRLENKEEYEKVWKAKNNKVIEPTLPTSFDFDDFAALNENTGSGATLSAEQRRDIRLAKKSPQMYCADRCVSTGHCDVLEDVLEMDAMEVIKFCKDCVLSVEEEPCDIPEKLLDGDYDFGSALMP